MSIEKISDKLFNSIANISSYLPVTPWFYVRRLTSFTGARILDIGCGEGDMARISGYNNANYVIGVDLYMSYLQINKKKKLTPMLFYVMLAISHLETTSLIF